MSEDIVAMYEKWLAARNAEIERLNSEIDRLKDELKRVDDIHEWQYRSQLMTRLADALQSAENGWKKCPRHPELIREARDAAKKTLDLNL